MSEHHPAVSVNWQKFSLLAIALVSMAGLVLLNRTTWAEVSPVFYLIVGYGTANGIGAAKGQSPTQLFTPTNPSRRATDSGPVVITPASDSSVAIAPADTLTETDE